VCQPERKRITIYGKKICARMLHYAKSPGIAPKGMTNPWMDVRIINGIIRAVAGVRNRKIIQW
jgi:hypothetical protein